MPLQNRVTPLGELIADPARGLVYGNRGCLHDQDGRIRRRYNGKRWIACRMEFRGWYRHPLMQPGRFTELFFLDEATAFAAGHRPCALCRRQDYTRFVRDLARTTPRPDRRGRDRRAAARRAHRSGDTRAAPPRGAARRTTRRNVRSAQRGGMVGARRRAAEVVAGRLRRARAASREWSSDRDHAAFDGRGSPR